MPRHIVHLELPARDTEQALAFWGSLLDRRFQAYPEGFEYHMAQVDERTGVAVTGMDDGLAGPRVYFDVDDIDAQAARVRELGGEASEKHPVPGMGWFSTCKDPEGNDFGLWQSDESAPPMG